MTSEHAKQVRRAIADLSNPNWMHHHGDHIETLVDAAIADATAELRAKLEARKAELDAVRTQAREDNIRAEMADQYEQWLTDLGRISGCGHVDERLPRCIEEAFDELRNEVERQKGAKAAMMEGAYAAMCGKSLHSVAQSGYRARSLRGDAWEAGRYYIAEKCDGKFDYQAVESDGLPLAKELDRLRAIVKPLEELPHVVIRHPGKVYRVSVAWGPYHDALTLAEALAAAVKAKKDKT